MHSLGFLITCDTWEQLPLITEMFDNYKELQMHKGVTF